MRLPPSGARLVDEGGEGRRLAPVHGPSYHALRRNFAPELIHQPPRLFAN
jgi:hypothetical protein